MVWGLVSGWGTEEDELGWPVLAMTGASKGNAAPGDI